MVSSQLSQAITGRRATFYPRSEEKEREEEWQKHGLKNSLKSILKSAHSSVKPLPEQALASNEVPKPEQKPTESKAIKKKSAAKPRKRLAAGRAFPLVGPRYNPQYYSIPQIKAAWELKGMHAHHRSTVLSHQRAQEILRQKQMLQDMLREHQKLQKDRASIALEIQSMKSFLGQISKRLDATLRKINVALPKGENKDKR